MSDYMAGKDVNTFIQRDAYSAAQSGGWSWGDLRNINYFLEHYSQAKISDEAKNHYAGIARFSARCFTLKK